MNVTGDFCSLDSAGKRVKNRSLGEMEQVGASGSSCGLCGLFVAAAASAVRGQAASAVHAL